MPNKPLFVNITKKSYLCKLIRINPHTSMKIALIGYGKMGHIIERVANDRGHEVVCIIDKDNVADIHSPAFRTADVAIEFTTPTTAESNVHAAWEENVPVVSGTTGWLEGLNRLRYQLTTPNSQLLFWTSNFSIGVNLFFRLNQRLADLMQPYPQYTPAITEIHHIHKLDAPSGTAVTLAQDIHFADKIESIREGEVPGTHTITWDSPVDKITITHEAKSREGFALGAVLAAEFLAQQKAAGKAGFFDMNDLLK